MFDLFCPRPERFRFCPRPERLRARHDVTGMNMSMPTAMATAMAIMCRAPARRDRAGSRGG